MPLGGSEGIGATLYHDDQITVIKAVTIRGIEGGGNHYSTLWIYVEGDEAYLVENFYLPTVNYIQLHNYTEYLSKSDAEPTKFKPYDYDGKIAKAYFSENSMMLGKSTDSEYTYLFGNRFGFSLVTPVHFSSNTNTLMVSLPNTGFVAFTVTFKLNGIGYNSELAGYINNDGNIELYGFAFGENGDVMVTQGLIKML